MVKKVVSPRSTGGSGFNYEDEVGAFFLSHMLINIPPLPHELGTIQRIDFQQRSQGWLLDDIVLILREDDKQHKCALSVKSNKQFTTKGAPKDFVQILWEQYLCVESNCFNASYDLLGIITPPHSINVYNALNTIIQLAKDQNSENLFENINKKGYVSEEQKNIFLSFECPKDLSKKYRMSTKDIGNLLKKFVFLELDFTSNVSRNKKEVVQYCRSALISGKNKEALSLWEQLIVLVREQRPVGGYVDITRLLEKLRRNYHLKNWPSHDSDWHKLIQYSKDYIERITIDIGGRITLTRSEKIKEINNILINNNFCILIGKSGCGKTVLSKMFVSPKKDKVFWFQSTDFRKTNYTEFENSLKLQNTLNDLFSVAPDKQIFIVIDGIEKLHTKEDFITLSQFISNVNIAQGVCKFILSCQEEEYKRIFSEIARYILIDENINHVNVNSFSDNELKEICEVFPNIQKLIYLPHLKNLLRTPKILDLIASKSSKGKIPDIENWISEADIVDWWWQEEIEMGNEKYNRSNVLKKIAEMQGDNLIYHIPIDDLTDIDRKLLNDLEKQRMLIVENEQVTFYHDCYSNWTRMRILLSKKDQLASYFKSKLCSPLWHQSLRLYGIRLLEKAFDEWISLFNDFKTNKKGDFQIGQDILLEASFFSTKPLEYLEQLYPILIENEGFFLKRLLERFWHVATIPNPFMIKIAQIIGLNSQVQASMVNRKPLYLLWPDMLQFLYHHLEDIIKFVPIITAEIVGTWLQNTKHGMQKRNESADLALRIAELIYDRRYGNDKIRFDERNEKLMYKAALLAFYEEPERLKKLILKLIKREWIYDPTKIQKETNSYYPGFHSTSPFKPPYPDGPSEKVDEAFQEVCLIENGLIEIMKINPALVQEIILALLIEHPKRECSDYVSRRLFDILALNEIQGFTPPFYDKGPFLLFLYMAPFKATETITRLINFATEIWAEECERNNTVVSKYDINANELKKEWIGDGHVFLWYTGMMSINHAIECALMALEYFIYDKYEKEEELVRKIISTILNDSKSLSFAGLLLNIGKKYPDLFLKELTPLLSEPNFYNWDVRKSLQLFAAMIPWSYRSELEVKRAQEWHNQEHKKADLRQIIMKLLISHSDANRNFEVVRSELKEKLKLEDEKTERYHDIEMLLVIFNKENYVAYQDERGKIIGVGCNFPDHITKRNKEFIDQIQKTSLPPHVIIRARMALDGKEEIKKENYEMWWNCIKQIEELNINNNEHNYKTSALCGCAAILLQFAGKLLKEYPERESCCKRIILNTILKPPSDDILRTEVSTSDLEWDSFCANVIPLLWLENPTNKQIRKCITLIITSKYYNTVGILFASLFNYKQKLGDHYKQLYRFAIEWAHIRYKKESRFYRDYDSQDVKKWLNKAISKFVNNKYKIDSIQWEDIACQKHIIEEQKTIKDNKRITFKPKIDLELIKSIHIGISNVERLTETNFVGECLQFWKKALNCLLWMFGNETEENTEVDRFIYDWDYWVLKNLAKLVIYLPKDENPEEFWKPILDLGVSAHYWIEEFISSFLLIGFDEKVDTKNFYSEWKKMIEYALNSPKWSFGYKHGKYNLAKLWCKLLCISPIEIELWKIRSNIMTEEIAKLYLKWACEWLIYLDCRIRLICFLKLPISEPLIIQALILINNIKIEFWGSYREEETLNEYLTDLLEICWSKYRLKLQQNREALDAFKNLLSKLVRKQYRPALELQRRVSQSNV